MRVLPVTLCLLAIYPAAPAIAQIAPSSVPLTLYTRCLNDAIAQNRTTKKGASIKFSCIGTPAKTFFDRMGGYGIPAKEQEVSNSGTYRVRAVAEQEGADFCWQKVASSDGASTASYGCDIFLPVGEFLNF